MSISIRDTASEFPLFEFLAGKGGLFSLVPFSTLLLSVLSNEGRISTLQEVPGSLLREGKCCTNQEVPGIVQDLKKYIF